MRASGERNSPPRLGRACINTILVVFIRESRSVCDHKLATRRARLSLSSAPARQTLMEPRPAPVTRRCPSARPYPSSEEDRLQAELGAAPVATLGVVPERGRGREGQRDGSRRERARGDSRGRSVDVGRTAPRAGSANPKKSCQRPRAAERALLCASSGGLQTHLMVLPVRMRIHWGMGRFCFCFLPRIFLILKVFWDGC